LLIDNRAIESGIEIVLVRAGKLLFVRLYIVDGGDRIALRNSQSDILVNARDIFSLARLERVAVPSLE
jgi:hypothetical protein